MADPSPTIGLPEAEYLELFNISQSIINLKTLRLSDATSSITSLPDYELGLQEYVLLTNTSSILKFGIENKIGVVGFPSLGNTKDSLVLSNLSGDIVDRTVYTSDWYGDTQKDDGGYSLELINPVSTCFGKANWKASTAELGGTPGQQNSVFSVAPDVDKPMIVSYDLISLDQITLHFNEPMDSFSVAEGTYTIANTAVNKVESSEPYFETAIVHFSQKIEKGKVYSFTVSGLKDCSGNEMVNAALDIGLGRKPHDNEILITEIMADPEPVVSNLPNSEYVEIYNSSDDLLSLEGLFFADATSRSPLAAQVIQPKSYLIICPNSSVSDFATHGEAMGLSNWPSLNNTGEMIGLYSGENLISSVNYEVAWHSAEQKDGGYSLEMKDVTNPCGGRLVWGSSTSPMGGTPGHSNANSESIPDNFGPEIIAAFAKDAHSVTLTFNEPLHFDALETVQITTDPVLEIDELELNQFRDQVTFSVEDALKSNIIYSITLNKVTDCSENPILKNTTTFVLPETADSLDLILNEILFDPKSTGVDFVEIYNHSQKNIDLKGWSLAREEAGVLTQVKTISEVHFILKPNDFLALTESAALLQLAYPKSDQKHFLEMPSMPTLPNEEGTVVLLDRDGQNNRSICLSE